MNKDKTVSKTGECFMIKKRIKNMNSNFYHGHRYNQNIGKSCMSKFQIMIKVK